MMAINTTQPKFHEMRGSLFEWGKMIIVDYVWPRPPEPFTLTIDTPAGELVVWSDDGVGVSAEGAGSDGP